MPLSFVEHFPCPGQRPSCKRLDHMILPIRPCQAFQEEMAQFREGLDAHGVPVSCALVALMAHGGPQGQLLGADGQEVQPEALVQELSRCRALWGCPKIFLLQACRGGQRDTGVGPTALPWFRRWLQASPTTPSHADVLQIYADAQGPTPGRSDQADILMVYAAAEGCVAYRDDEKGSDFIQTLVEVLRADPGGELLELLTEVNRRVCELEVLGPDGQRRRKACLEIRSSLRRRLCLQAPHAGAVGMQEMRSRLSRWLEPGLGPQDWTEHSRLTGAVMREAWGLHREQWAVSDPTRSGAT
ncbi:putative caspase-16 [Neovison vison]|uniref:putative caspase-16 n=1 Tax=Neovison vison TaxID=452646 RepID=UPI001CF02A92|nr:putative caspase-16 [Neogale vison]